MSLFQTPIHSLWCRLFSTSGKLSACVALSMLMINLQAQSTVTDVGARNIIKLLADPARSVVYGLNRAADGQNSSVVAFDAANGAILKEVTVGGSPTDFDLSARSDVLYVIHMINRITRINLQTFAVNATRDLGAVPNWGTDLHYDIAAGRPGLVYFTDAAWAPDVYVYDFENSQTVSVYDPGDEGTGDLALTKDGNTLYTWRQYGWTAGVISTYVRKSDASSNGLVPQDISQTYGEREPFDTPILLNATEQRVFYKTRVHDASDLKRVLTTFPEHIYSISLHGELAFGTSKVFNGFTGAQIGNMPFPTTITAVSADQKRLFAYSSSTRKLVTTPLSQYGEVSGPGLIPNPRNGEAVSAGLAELSWSSSPVASRYEIYLGSSSNEVRTASTNSTLYLGSVPSTSFTLNEPVRQQGNYFWRVDIVSISGTTRGPVWQFQVAPIVVLPKKITLVAIAGSSPTPTPITVQTNGANLAWSVTESIPWATVSPAEGTGNATVLVALDLSSLAPGVYTNALRFASGSYAFEVPVELQVIPLQITKMIADLERPYIYALQGASGEASQSYLVFINSDTARIEKTIPLGRNLVDLDISYGEARLYVADWGQDITHVIDLQTQTPLDPLHLGTDVFKINAGRPGRLFTEGHDQWVGLAIFDSLTGTLVHQISVREGDGEVDPTGNYYYHCDNNISNAHIQKYRVSDDTFQHVKSSLQHPYGSRHLLLSGDGSRLFWRGFVYDADLNELGSLNEEIYATTLRGELAFGERSIINSVNGQVLTNLPFASAVKTVSGNQERLFAFNSDSKRLEVFQLSNITPVQGVDLVPTPAHGQSVSLPLPELSWSTSPFALRYKIYFGTNEAAVSAATETSPEFLGETQQTKLPLSGSLTLGQTYYWRVDGVGFSSIRKGPTWNFQTSPVSIAPKTISIQTVSGAPLPTRTLEITGSNVPWTTAENSPWFSVTPGTGTGNATLTLSITDSNLPPGIYTNVLELTAGGATVQVPVTLQVFKMALSKMVADLERPYIYGLHPGSGTFEDAFLIFINTVSGQIENVLPIGANPTDFAINYFEDRLYVSNWLRNRTRVVDLVQQVELPSLELGADVYKINAGRAGRIFIEQQDQWIDMNIIDTLTGTQIARGFVREGDGEGDPTGAFYYHCDNNSSGATLQKYRVSNDAFEHMASSPNHGYGSRNLLMSGDGSRLFWMGYIYNSDLQELGGLGDEIYAATKDGQFAVSSTKVYDTVSRQANFTLPFSTTVMAVAGSQDKIFLYKADGTIHILEMREITNRPPVAQNLVLQMDEDSSVTILPLASDPDSDPLSYELVTLPESGEITVRDDSWIFRPATNFSGALSFSYIARDPWRASLQAAITVNVTPINDPPMVQDGNFVVVTDLPRHIQLNATDPDGDALTYTIVTQPQHGSLDPAAWEFTPEPGYSGSDQFTFRVSDGKSAPVQGTVTLTIKDTACASAPVGLVNWWPGENSLQDAIGGQPLQPATWTNYAPAMVGRGFNLSSESPELSVAHTYHLAAAPGFTVEAWFKPAATNYPVRILGWDEGAAIYLQDGRLALVAPIGGAQTVYVTSQTPLEPNVLQHLALTFDAALGKFTLYSGGRRVAEHSIQNLPAQTLGAFRLGAPSSTLFNAPPFAGIFDEVSLYSRALGASEIEDLFLAMNKGKCALALAPSFTSGPQVLEIAEGGTLELTRPLVASGPVSFQWSRDGELLPGQTNATLTITNFSAPLAGIYSLTASNAFGSAHSAGAYVTFRAGPRLNNGSFETGNTSGWIVNDISAPFNRVRVVTAGYRPSSLFFQSAPTDGRFALVHGFDGAGPGTIRVAQEITVPAGNPVLTFDYRAAWNLRTAAYDRTINVVIEPSGGGAAFDFFTFVRAPAGSFVPDTGRKSGSVDLSAYAGQTIRVSFDAEVPEANRGPGFFQLDNVAVVTSGVPRILSQPRNTAVVENQQSVSLRVQAEGAGPLTYQWFRNGQPLVGARNADLVFNASAGFQGTYTVAVSNSLGSATSRPINVEILQPKQLGTPYLDHGAIWLPVAMPSGSDYILETSSDLNTWTYLGRPMLIDSALSTFTIPDGGQRFYRVSPASP